MKSSSRPKFTTAANIDNMMERLGIDGGCCVVPRFSLLFSLCAAELPFLHRAGGVRGMAGERPRRPVCAAEILSEL